MLELKDLFSYPDNTMFSRVDDEFCYYYVSEGNLYLLDFASGNERTTLQPVTVDILKTQFYTTAQPKQQIIF